MPNFPTDTKLFFLNAIDNLRDPVRSTRWRVLIPQEVLRVIGLVSLANGSFDATVEGTSDFALHVKSCKIPDRNLETAEQFYMGFSQAHVTNTQLGADIPLESILLEDMRAYQAMHTWQSMCMNTGVLKAKDGSDIISSAANIRLGAGVHKDAANNDLVSVVRNSTVAIELYNFMNDNVIARYTLLNAFPKSVGGYNLSYQSASLINFPFTLHCDNWSFTAMDDYAKTGNSAIG